jgi:hypothetical protein
MLQQADVESSIGFIEKSRLSVEVVAGGLNHADRFG